VLLIKPWRGIIKQAVFGNAITTRIFPDPEKANNYPGSFSKWWTAVTSGMYITLNLAQKLNETLLGMR
jgi:hypothetical protein